MSDMFKAIADEFANVFDPKSIASAVAAALPKIALAILTLLFFWVLWRLIDRALRRLGEREVLDSTAIAFINATTKYAIIAMAVVSALGRVGVDTSSVLASLGIAGLTLGFAARDSLSNIISGIFIFWDRPFVIGDLVEINGQYGRVETITMRSTRVVTVDGKMLAVPNALVAAGTVVSYTNFPQLRIDIPVTVGVNEDIGRVRDLLVEAASGHLSVVADKAPAVVVKNLNDYNIEVELRVWIGDEREHLTSRVQLRELILETLRAAKVEMPFETLVVHQAAA